MQHRLIINHQFDGVEEFFLNIKSYFHESNQIIHKARNELKIIKYQNLDLVVKAFKIPHFINQFAYSYIRGSKAKKSYENGMKLIELDINTPIPIGYIEFYNNGLLHESFFVSLYQPYDFLIREPLYCENFVDRENIIKAFVHFTYGLHQKRIYHNDYSAGNTLVIKNESSCEYRFSIVDINRMEFGHIDIYKAMKNFNKLWANEKSLVLIAKEYALLSGYPERKCVELILKYDRELKIFVERKRLVKSFLRGRKWV